MTSSRRSRSPVSCVACSPIATSALPYLALCVAMYLFAQRLGPCCRWCSRSRPRGSSSVSLSCFTTVRMARCCHPRRANAGPRLGPRPVRAVSVSSLAPRPRRPPRDLGRPRPARSRRYPHADGRGVLGPLDAGRLGLPDDSQSARDVRSWPGVRDDHRTADRLPRGAAPDAQQRARHRRRAGRSSSVACWAIGWRAFLIVWAPAALLAGSIGIWLFYVQHQFEDAYWQNRGELELRRCCATRELLPEATRWCCSSSRATSVCTTCITSTPGFPTTTSSAPTDASPRLAEVPTLSLWDALRAVRFKLWDERAAGS